MNNEIHYSDGIRLNGLMSLSPKRLTKMLTVQADPYLSTVFTHQNASGRAAFYLHTNLFKNRQEEYYNIVENAYNEWYNLPKESRDKIRPYFYVKGRSSAFVTLKTYIKMEIIYLDYLGLYTLTDAQKLTFTVKETTE